MLRQAGPTPPRPSLPHLGPGEASCLRLALAHQGPVLLLMDDRLGRRAARLRSLHVTGAAALVGQAAKADIVASARDVFARLLVAEFRITPAVIRWILRDVGELDDEADGT